MAKFRTKERELRYRDMVKRSRGFLDLFGYDHSNLSDYAAVMHSWRATNRTAKAIRKCGLSIEEAAKSLRSVGNAFGDLGRELEKTVTVEF